MRPSMRQVVPPSQSKVQQSHTWSLHNLYAKTEVYESRIMRQIPEFKWQLVMMIWMTSVSFLAGIQKYLTNLLWDNDTPQQWISLWIAVYPFWRRVSNKMPRNCEHSLYVTCIFSENEKKTSKYNQKLSDLSHEISPKSKHLGYPFNKYALKIFGSKVQSGDDATHQVCHTTNTPSVKYPFFHAHASGCRLWQKLMRILLLCCCFPKGLFDKDKNSSRIVEWLNASFFVHKWTSCTLSLPIRLRKASLDALATTPKMKAKAAGVLIPEWPAAISWKSNSKVCPYKYAEKRTKGKKNISKN